MTTGDRIDVLIIGSGLGGCAAALSAARAGAHVVMLTKGVRAEDSNTWEAQGGIIYRGVNDSPERLAADIVAAGAGLCYPEAVELLSREGPRLVEEVLISHAGVPFDRAPDGTLDLTAEAAHCLPRSWHASWHAGSGQAGYPGARQCRTPRAQWKRLRQWRIVRRCGSSRRRCSRAH